MFGVVPGSSAGAGVGSGVLGGIGAGGGVGASGGGSCCMDQLSSPLNASIARRLRC